MKKAYPALIKKNGNDYLVYVPDLNFMTEGRTLYKAIIMVRDLLGTVSMVQNLPQPSSERYARIITKQFADGNDFKFSDGILVYVDIDTDAYKRNKTVA